MNFSEGGSNSYMWSLQKVLSSHSMNNLTNVLLKPSDSLLEWSLWLYLNIELQLLQSWLLFTLTKDTSDSTLLICDTIK